MQLFEKASQLFYRHPHHEQFLNARGVCKQQAAELKSARRALRVCMRCALKALFFFLFYFVGVCVCVVCWGGVVAAATTTTKTISVARELGSCAPRERMRASNVC